MTLSTASKPNWPLALGIPFLIGCTCLLITLLPVFQTQKLLLSNAILADLLVSAPLAYLFLIRKTNVSKLTVLRIFIISVVFAGLLLPSHSNPALKIIKTWISPAIELFVVVMIYRKFRLANKTTKTAAQDNVDFLMYCRNIMQQVTGNEKVGNILSSEIAVFYYAFSLSKVKPIDYRNSFSSYRQNGLRIVLYAILSIFLIETAGMHFIMRRWDHTLAWILTGLSGYTCLQLFAHIRAIKARPIVINSNSFEIHNGLSDDTLIEFSNIAAIEYSKKIPINRNAVKIALFKGLENHNLIVYLKAPVTVTKMFGLKKQSDTILFFVDQPEIFAGIVDAHVSINRS